MILWITKAGLLKIELFNLTDETISICLDVALTISGFNGSTDVASLEEAMQSLRIDVILPGLKSNLLAAASLTGT